MALDVTYGIEHIHKESIITCIKQHVDFVSAVLILADGRSLGTTAEIDCTLSALSALFPKTLVNNIAFMLTHVGGPSCFDFFQSKVLGNLNNGPIFLLDDPIMPSYKFSFDRNVRSEGLACEQRSLGLLAELFDWLDSLEPQPATEIVYLHELYQNIEAKTIHILDQRAREVEMRAEIDRLVITLKKHSAVSHSPCLHLTLASYACWM